MRFPRSMMTIAAACMVSSTSGGSLYLLVPNGQFPPNTCKTH